MSMLASEILQRCRGTTAAMIAAESTSMSALLCHHSVVYNLLHCRQATILLSVIADDSCMLLLAHLPCNLPAAQQQVAAGDCRPSQVAVGLIDSWNASHRGNLLDGEAAHSRPRRGLVCRRPIVANPVGCKGEPWCREVATYSQHVVSQAHVETVAALHSATHAAGQFAARRSLTGRQQAGLAHFCIKYAVLTNARRCRRHACCWPGLAWVLVSCGPQADAACAVCALRKHIALLEAR